MPRKVKTAFTASDEDRAITGIHDVGFIPKCGRSTASRCGRRDPDRRRHLDHAADRPHPERLRRAGRRRLPEVDRGGAAIFDRQEGCENRMRARIKVLVDKIGMDAFREMVEEELEGDWVNERLLDRPPALHPRRGGERARRPGELWLAERRPLRVRRLVEANVAPSARTGFATAR